MSLEHKDAVLPELPTEVLEEEKDRQGLLAELVKDNPDLYGDIQQHRTAEWRRIVRAFEESPDDFYNAWHYLNQHPLFWYISGTRDRIMPLHEKYLQAERGLPEGLDISVMKVDPETNRVSDDKAKNTKVEIWYEICMTRWPAQYDSPRAHVWQLDGGGETYEDAVVKAARQVHKMYGNDRRVFGKGD